MRGFNADMGRKDVFEMGSIKFKAEFEKGAKLKPEP